MMKILILGGTGFIGRNLVEQFCNKYKIYSPKRSELNLLNFYAVKDYLNDLLPDVVINATVNINSVHENLQVFNNIEANKKSFGKFFQIGSGAEYDKRSNIPFLTEDCFGHSIPEDAYGLSKYTIAKLIENCDQFYNFRVFGIFGPYEDYTRRFISNNIVNVLKSDPIIVNQNSIFDYLYVNDFVRMIDILINKNLHEKQYNLCSGQGVSLVDLAYIIKSVTKSDKDICVVNSDIKMNYTGSNKKILEEISGFDFTPVDIAIAELYKWYQSNWTPES